MVKVAFDTPVGTVQVASDTTEKVTVQFQEVSQVGVGWSAPAICAVEARPGSGAATSAPPTRTDIESTLRTRDAFASRPNRPLTILHLVARPRSAPGRGQHATRALIAATAIEGSRAPLSNPGLPSAGLPGLRANGRLPRFDNMGCGPMRTYRLATVSLISGHAPSLDG